MDMQVKLIFKMQCHSMIDVITNSSTEIFCTVKGAKEAAIWKVLDDILKEVGCSAVEFTVREAYDWDTDKKIEDAFEITYDRECYHAPCKLIIKRLKEDLKKLNCEFLYED